MDKAVSQSPVRRRLKKYQQLLALCSAESVSYGKCVGQELANVKKGSCEKEFQALLTCIRVAASRIP
ncbi:unnamed protein product [Cyprideis torosa]|uniref:Uncharacterized protein n=1 Tax=Cyprideis torosa TaxID=163714 RepID=A0A7R8ZUR9_9CRUS|nr:unnamed protein product [Cyprideis torosa]CAG0900839.1 unnamed protein product [Cyprideis torosa]